MQSTLWAPKSKYVRIKYINSEGEEAITGLMDRKSAEKYKGMYKGGVIVDDENGGNK